MTLFLLRYQLGVREPMPPPDKVAKFMGDWWQRWFDMGELPEWNAFKRSLYDLPDGWTHAL